MIPRWIPDHYLRILRLLPGQFPGNPSEGDSNWQRLARTLAHVAVGDAVVSFAVDPLRVTLDGDQTARFPVGFVTAWGGSSVVPRARDGGNDGRYTVTAVALSGGDTVVTLEEDAPQTQLADLGYLRGNDTSTLATGVQELEEVLIDLRDQFSLSRATGRLLEVFGEILGLSRTSLDDHTYRADLRVQAAILHGNGRIEELIAVGAGLPGVTFVLLLEPTTARVFLYMLGPTGPVPSTGTQARLQSAKAGGVALDLFAGTDNPFVFGFDMDGAGVGAAPPGEDPDGEGFGEAYPIVAVLVGGAGAGALYVGGDATGALVVGDELTVQGSTNNDGTKTITVLTYEAGPVRTRIDIAEAVGAVADGHVLDGGDTSGDFVEAL